MTFAFYTSRDRLTQFGVRWTGMINITQAGPTTFTTSSDDSTRLYIDGVLVIDNDDGHGVQIGFQHDQPERRPARHPPGLHPGQRRR